MRVPVPWVFVLTYLAGGGIEAAFHGGGFFRDYKLLTPVGFVGFTFGAGLAAWGWLSSSVRARRGYRARLPPRSSHVSPIG